MAGVWLERPDGGLWRRHSDAVNRRLVERWLPGSLDSVLKTDLFDEAVSEGLAPSLLERAVRLVGIDVSTEIADAARARHPRVETVVADVRALPFDDATFDAVVSNSTLDHFDDEREIAVAIAELARVLCPGGLLVLTLDNPLNPVLALGKALPRTTLNRTWRALGRPAARVGLAPYYVGATLGREELRKVVRAAGLDVRAETTLIHAPRLVAVVVAALLERRSPAAQSRFLGLLAAFEALGRTPARRFTAHLNALLAEKPGASPRG
jgi:SAM-dependent methyltransferase